MKKTCLAAIILLLVLPASVLVAQKNVYQSKDVVKTAEQIKFQYKDVLKKAIGQDQKAIGQLFEFSRILDGQEALEHAVTCLEIIPFVTDKVMALALEQVNPKLRTASLERLVQAQGLTDKAELKKPIQSWAPYTWEALNNRPVIFPSTATPAGSAGGTLQDADKPAPAATDGSLKPANSGNIDSRNGGGN